MKKNDPEVQERFYKVPVDSEVGVKIGEFWAGLDDKIGRLKWWMIGPFDSNAGFLHNSSFMHSFKVVGFTHEIPGLKKHKTWDCYVPNMRTKAGKDIQKELDEFSHGRMEDVLYTFGFADQYYGENTNSGTVIRWASFSREHEGFFYIKRPQGAGENKKHEMHADLIEIKQSEYIKAMEDQEEANEAMEKEKVS